MICMIDARHAPKGFLDPLPYGPQDTLVFNEELREVRIPGTLRVRNLIIPSHIHLVVDGALHAVNLAVGQLTVYAGVEAELLTSQGDVMVSGDLLLGAGKSDIAKRLMVRGDVRASGSLRVNACARITGAVALAQDLDCADVWAPSLGQRSRTEAQEEAAAIMNQVIGRVEHAGFFSRILKLVA